MVDSAYPAYLDALLRGDRRAALEVVSSARARGVPLADLYLSVFQPALREIGRRWQLNELTVADEHLATAITQLALARLYEEVFAAAPALDGPSLVAACVDVERHEVGLRMLCDLLEMEGWDTTFLGATVPIESLVSMVSDRRPEVVALSAALLPHVARVAAVVQALRELPEPPFILVGGRAFLDKQALAQHIGADATAMDARAAVELLRNRFAA